MGTRRTGTWPVQSVVDLKAAGTDDHGQTWLRRLAETFCLACTFEMFQPMGLVVGEEESQDQGKEERSYPQE